MKFKYNDGGRKTAGYKGSAGDCAIRAIAIASKISYKVVYKEIFEAMNTPKKKKTESPRDGVPKKIIKQYLKAKNWEWTPTMGIGTGCHTHVKENELPKGKIILSLSKHLATVIDGVLNDTYDCSRNETRCVYGYWRKGINND